MTQNLARRGRRGKAPTMRLSAAVTLALLLGLCSCVATPRGAAKAQEAALDLNVNARFGRMEIAAERVADKGREEFFGHRRGWGGRVRVADLELAGVRLTGDDDADVTVRVAWYRVDEEELKVTTLRQKWHLYGEDWKLVAEARTDGELGLLGEAAPPPSEPGPKKNVQFPTIRITGADLSPRAE